MTQDTAKRNKYFTNAGMREYFCSLRYCLYTARRPLVGFWDLIHEGKGTMAAAHTIVAIAILVEILTVTSTNFQFRPAYMEVVNIFTIAAQIILPIFLWTVANWSLTTLMDGKGRLRDIYMGTAYALAPMVIINAILIPLSHVITFDEGVMYWLLLSIGMLWFAMLLVCAMMEIHDYSMSKTILSSLFTLVAIGIMLFIFVVFFAVVSDGIAFFVSVVQEAMFRVR